MFFAIVGALMGRAQSIAPLQAENEYNRSGDFWGAFGGGHVVGLVAAVNTNGGRGAIFCARIITT